MGKEFPDFAEEKGQITKMRGISFLKPLNNDREDGSFTSTPNCRR